MQADSLSAKRKSRPAVGWRSLITECSNLATAPKNETVLVEDACGSLHSQRNALDSCFLFDVRANYAAPATQAPVRILALGRDPAPSLIPAWA